MYARHLGNLVAYREHGIEGRHGLLKHHGNAIAAHPANLFVARGQKIASLEPDVASLLDASRRLHQT